MLIAFGCLSDELFGGWIDNVKGVLSIGVNIVAIDEQFAGNIFEFLGKFHEKKG